MSNEHPIHEAAWNGDIDAIKQQLSLGVSINIKGGYGGLKKAVLNLIILLFLNKKEKIKKKREERKMIFLFLYLYYYLLLIDEWRLLSFMLHGRDI